MKIQKAVAFLILFFLAFDGYSQTAFTPKCKKAYTTIAALEFKKAEEILNAEKYVDPDNQVIVFLEDYIDFLKVFISEKATLYEKALDKRDKRLDKIDQLPEENPFKKYLKGEIYLHWASIKGKMGDRFSAAVDLNKAYRLLKENHEQFPEFVPGYAGLGVIEVLIGTIPEKYGWLANLLNLEGTVEGGRQRIQHLLSLSQGEDSWAFLEYPTLFMLSFIELNTGHKIEPAILQRYKSYHRKGTLRYQPLLVFAYANLLQKERKNELTLQVLNSYEKSHEEYPFYYLDYMKGLAYLFKNSEKCLYYFDDYIDKFPGRHYIKSAYQKKAWYYLINGDTVRYRYHISFAAEEGYAYIGADKHAENEAVNETIPNVALLKARLFFDGGYYEKAMKSLNFFTTKEQTQEEVTEFYYRKGRILHETGKLDSALDFYTKAYHRGKDLETYHAANAALMSGKIYEQKNLDESALKQYDKALNLKGFEYQLSIHQKAEAGKSRIEERHQ